MKNNSILFCFIFLCFAEKICSQDTLNLKNGQQKIVQIIKVGIDEIEYKRFDNLAGPLYVAAKKRNFKYCIQKWH